MKNKNRPKMRFFAGFKLCLLLALLGFSVIVNAQSVRSSSQVGTVQGLAQDDGFITISGNNYPFANEVTTVMLRGEEIDAAILDQGFVVRYTLNQQGVLLLVEIIGPAAKIDELDNN